MRTAHTDPGFRSNLNQAQLFGYFKLLSELARAYSEYDCQVIDRWQPRARFGIQFDQVIQEL